MPGNDQTDLQRTLSELSGTLDLNQPSLGIILAAGHGKRIKSETSKMLHQIWGVPTVERVSQAVRTGLGTDNLIIVVGVKAADVASAVGRKPHTVFAYQGAQRGTGHAVQTALKVLDRRRFAGRVLVCHGDVGLLTAQTITHLVDQFERQHWDMAILTAMYEGHPDSNYYGRIVRMGAGGRDQGRIVGIVEYKDIKKCTPNKVWKFRYRGREYRYTGRQLLEIAEFNAGVYAFRAGPLRKYINQVGSDRVQSEIYLTDLIKLFVDNGLSVGAHVAEDSSVSLGFNNKSVLRQMESIARQRVYDRIRDIITIKNEEHFFIADEVVEDIIRLDGKGKPLDIVIGEDAAIHAGAKLNYGVVIGRGAVLDGNIILGRSVEIGDLTLLSTYPHQTMRIGDDCVIMRGDMIKGNITIADRARIESNVIITGSDEYPVQIGENVEIKGTSYIFGCAIEPDVRILHSVLLRQRIARIIKRDGSIQPVRYVLPQPEGMDSIEPLDGPASNPK